ncbi:unnamed protein product [Oikopleura dioica]|uniref:Doublecortin domain-containing protein n=1 Tax=Oikopleura dioica TaxID=34765 RepID=E4YLS0_OIKDI|nr:unnamed protein product [Oikopleura dioica]
MALIVCSVDLYGSQATPTSSIDLDRLESPYLNKAFEQSSMSSKSSNSSKISKTSSRNSSRRSSRASSVASSKSLNSTLLSDATLLPDSIISSSSTMERLRPYSAQNRTPLSRPVSGRRPLSAGGRATPLYMRARASGIRCTVVKSDDRSRFATLCVSSMLQLLDEATQKLKLTIPARRAFLGDGSEVKSVLEIPRDEPVFVASSASTRTSNPKKAARIAKKQVEATKRLSGYNMKTKVRVCQNGSGRVVCVLVNSAQFKPESAAPDAMEKLLVDVQSALALPVKVKALYKWNGKRIKSASEVTESQEPLWATTGADAFLSLGPLQWYRCCLKMCENEINEKKGEEHECGDEEMQQVVDKDHRLVSSSSSFKLRVYENGRDDVLLLVVVNFEQLHKEGARSPGNDGFQLLMQTISDKLFDSKQKRFRIKKLFNSQGTQLTELEEIEKDMEIWFSDGEPFITAESEKIVMDLQQIMALDEDGELFLLDEGRIQNPAEELPNTSIKNWALVKNVDYYDFEGLESKAEVAHEISHKIQQQEQGAKRVKNGSAVILKQKTRQFAERVSFEEKERKNAARWKEGEVQTVEEEEKKRPEMSKQQFVMERSGHIVSAQNRKLVLATEKGKKVERGMEIMLQAKSSDEAGQIWERDGACIRNVVNPELVLTALNNRLVLERKAANEYGSSQQKFEFDNKNGGGIRVAVGDSKELDLTAAINCGICTYCICAGKELQQFGYLEDGMHFCQICAPLLPGLPSSHRLKDRLSNLDN